MGRKSQTKQKTETPIPEAVENILAEKDFNKEQLVAIPEAEQDAEMKNFLINYTGYKLQPESGKVNVTMIAELLAAEFPEFMYAIAEENFIRGYQVGLEDAVKLHQRETEETESEE
jgi:uncharacterized protein YdeI (YjbR/CyaY-like superfamily)